MAGTTYHGLFDIVLWCIIFIVLRPAFKPPYKLKKSSRVLGIGLILLFCLFPFFAGDYYHAIDSYNSIRKGGYFYYEYVYVWIIQNVAFSYFFFRLIVWGGGLAILFFAYKRIGRNFDLTLFFFGTLYLPLFSYARASLAMAILILGMTFFYSPLKNSKVFSYVIGIVVVSCAVFFHRSSIVGIVSVFMTLLIFHNTKWKLFFLILLVPAVLYFLSYFLDSVMAVDFDSVDEMMNRKLNNYLENDESGAGFARRLSNFLTRSPMFLSAILYVVLVIKDEIRRFSKIERAVASYVFCIMLVALSFALNQSYNTSVLYYRTINYAMPANALFLMSIKSKRLENVYFKVIYYLTITATFYLLCYSTYLMS